jgi:hypothetical protein
MRKPGFVYKDLYRWEGVVVIIKKYRVYLAKVPADASVGRYKMI